MARYAATLIVSIYKDITKLRCILETLAWQTSNEFEILVSEDGADDGVGAFLQPYRTRLPNLSHLTQEDRGFRKNRALNRAILAAQSDFLIFIDGDCVPHSHFVEAHIRNAESRAICAGRRVELGALYSQRLIEQPEFLLALENPWRYLTLARALHRDGIKNYEFGFVSPLLHNLTHNRPIHIVGSNFSCPRAALETVNGFNEDFESPGIGEDADLEWRMEAAGYHVKNIKFLATVYHLHHPRSYVVSERNREIMTETRTHNIWRCARGLDQAKP
ncbi:MAG: glycosyltransferase family 2 protein [Thiohalomonadaceae bacterium]